MLRSLDLNWTARLRSNNGNTGCHRVPSSPPKELLENPERACIHVLEQKGGKFRLQRSWPPGRLSTEL
eukprot:807075-Amphidinium_carterae.1